MICFFVHLLASWLIDLYIGLFVCMFVCLFWCLVLSEFARLLCYVMMVQQAFHLLMHELEYLPLSMHADLV